MKIRFRNIRLSAANRERLAVINSNIEEYQEQNLVLTLRQLYYQLVSRDIILNKQNPAKITDPRAKDFSIINSENKERKKLKAIIKNWE